MANVITVSALNSYTRTLLEADPVLTDIAICGEISNFKQHYKTGHCYFSLKDDKSSVRAVMFKSYAQGLSFRPEDGISVVARCRVSLYERDGSFQLYVENLFPDGIGAAQLAYEQLKQKLESENFFNPEYKKPLPRFPNSVGLVTSKTGAALQDILKVATQRCPTINFVLAPVTVQGFAAAEEISAAIKKLDDSKLVDCIVVARGGGSAEDLWVFNAESIARAAFACSVPIVSAIGHETDVTILDFVADKRAATPSAAIEILLPDLHELMRIINILYKNIAENIHKKQSSWYNKLNEIKQNSALLQANKTIKDKYIVLEKSVANITEKIKQKHMFEDMRMNKAFSLAAAQNPYGLLAKGYSIARKDKKVIASVEHLNINDEIVLTLADGTANCCVNNVFLGNITKGECTNGKHTKL